MDGLANAVMTKRQSTKANLNILPVCEIKQLDLILLENFCIWQISYFSKVLEQKKTSLGCDIRGNGVIVCLLFLSYARMTNATNLYRSEASCSLRAYFSMHPHDRKRIFVPGDWNLRLNLIAFFLAPRFYFHFSPPRSTASFATFNRSLASIFVRDGIISGL